MFSGGQLNKIAHKQQPDCRSPPFSDDELTIHISEKEKERDVKRKKNTKLQEHVPNCK